MAAARTVIAGSNGNAPAVGNVFEGERFFLVQRLPTRSRFVEDIQANGGQVVRQEKEATYVIADHARKDVPGGSYSYTLIEAAIRDGAMPANPGDHATSRAMGDVRDVGSALPSKKTRKPFTMEEDILLYEWVKKHEAMGAGVSGNDIYKKLEAIHPQHPNQAWRDRYVKKLKYNPPKGAQVTVAANPPPSPPEDASEHEEEAPTAPKGNADSAAAESETNTQEDESVHAVEDDIELLLGNAKDIEDMDDETSAPGWFAWAQAHPWRTATEWRAFYEAEVRPTYLEQKRTRQSDQTEESEKSIDSHGSRKAAPRRDITEQISQAQTPSKRKHVHTNSAAEGSSRSRKRRAVASDQDASDGQRTQSRRRSVESKSRDAVDTVQASEQDQQAPAQRQQANNDENTVNQTSNPGETVAELPAQRAAIGPQALQNVDDSVLTSEANRAAESQLLGRIAGAALAESDAAMSEGVGVSLRDDTAQAPIQTSEINHQADVQMQEEAANSKMQSADSASQTRVETTKPEDKSSQQQLPNEARERPSQTMLETLQNLHGRQNSTNDDGSQIAEHAQRAWSTAEDEVVVKGIRLNWKASKVIENLPAGCKRTTSAVRRRRLVLIEEERAQRARDPQKTHRKRQLAWNKMEDDVVLKGMRLKWKARKIVDNLPDPTQRDSNAVRNRRATLRAKYGDKLLLVNSDDESDSTGASQLDEDVETDQEPEVGPEAPINDPVVSSAGNEREYSPGLASQIEEDGDIDGIDKEADQPQAEIQVEQDLAGQRDGNSPGSTSQPLTAANLAQHKRSYNPRGVDLEEDDDEENQFDFIRKLQALTGTNHGDEILALENKQHVIAEGGNATSDQPAFDGELPVSSDQEIHDVFEDGLKWPASPKQRKTRPEIHQRRPVAGLSHAGPSAQPQGGGFQFSSQSLLSQLQETGASHEGHTKIPADENLPDALNGLAENESEPSEQEEEDGKAFSKDNYSAFGDDFDLYIPEPDGGFDYTPSPEPEAVVDLGMSEPTGGFDTSPVSKPNEQGLEAFGSAVVRNDEPIEIGSSSSSNSSYHSSQDRDETLTQQPTRALETQDILNAETQAPDLSMPLPPDTDDEIEEDDGPRPQSQHWPASRDKLFVEQEAESQESTSDLDAWMNTMQVRGFDEASIIKALKSTSMYSDLATLVLYEEKAGKGLPDDVPGIWSEEEDRALESGNAPAIRALAEKHGWDKCEERQNFLEDYRDEE